MNGAAFDGSTWTVGRTLDFSDALLKNLLQDLGVLELLLDLGDDGGGELLLLALLNLAFVADPGVEDGLGFSGNGRLLLELVCLGFELGGFLAKDMYCQSAVSFPARFVCLLFLCS